MGKTKGIQVVTVFFVIFLVGGFVWFSLIKNHSNSQTWSGKKYGSPDKPIVLEFQAGSRHDYWELTYTTSGYNSYGYEVTVYILDRCSFDLYMQGSTPNSENIISENQVTTLTLRLNDVARCKNDNDNAVYIVWDIQEGTVIVHSDSLKVYYFTVKGFYGYLFGGLALFGLLYTFVLYKSKRPSKDTKLVKKYSQRFIKRNFCALCGIEIPKNAEFCPYCGKVYTTPNLDKIKSKKSDV